MWIKESFMYKKCAQCKKTFPEYMVSDYKNLLKTPLCAVCAKTLLDKVFGRSPEAGFKDENEREFYEETRDFINNKSKRVFGGHLINPPEECPFRFKNLDGGVWTDLGNCIASCKDRCVRYYKFKGMSKEERLEELFEESVIEG